MVKKYLTMLLLFVSGCGGPDDPTECPARLPEERVTLALFERYSEEKPLPVCLDWNVASRRDATADSAGVDESFATTRGGVIPWTNVTYEEAASACGRAGKFLCRRRILTGLIPFRPEVGGTLPEAWIGSLSPTFGDPVESPLAGFLWDEARDTQPVVPDINGSIAVWTGEGDVIGRIAGKLVRSNDGRGSPNPGAGFKHPLLGFRCCIDARLYTAFAPLPEDPSLVREEVEDVPIYRP